MPILSHASHFRLMILSFGQSCQIESLARIIVSLLSVGDLPKSL
jgi:hypothetical protein